VRCTTAMGNTALVSALTAFAIWLHEGLRDTFDAPLPDGIPRELLRLLTAETESLRCHSALQDCSRDVFNRLNAVP